jgi:hypothetical protein
MSNDKNQELREALFELQCISEIMEVMGKLSEVPGTWVDWLGKQVCRIAERVDLASL